VEDQPEGAVANTIYLDPHYYDIQKLLRYEYGDEKYGERVEKNLMKDMEIINNRNVR
jgi:hypothetical protein